MLMFGALNHVHIQPGQAVLFIKMLSPESSEIEASVKALSSLRSKQKVTRHPQARWATRLHLECRQVKLGSPVQTLIHFRWQALPYPTSHWRNEVLRASIPTDENVRMGCFKLSQATYPWFIRFEACRRNNAEGSHPQDRYGLSADCPFYKEIWRQRTQCCVVPIKIAARAINVSGPLSYRDLLSHVRWARDLIWDESAKCVGQNIGEGNGLIHSNNLRYEVQISNSTAMNGPWSSSTLCIEIIRVGPHARKPWSNVGKSRRTRRCPRLPG
ncbi:hypothetical protein F5Y05DRAFT_312540 [Hypoxylon sp. FL0543]|nr:hypothetical protein F5Y05DRAFT_312540 [Hypoxylon sp. FL0543]